MRNQAGFTLIEVLIVVAVIGVVAAITVPMVGDAMDRYSVISASQQVASTVRAGRFQAVARNTTVRVRFDSPAAGQYEREVYDADTTSWVSADSQYLPSGVSFTAPPAEVKFDASGRLPYGDPVATIVVSNGNAAADRTITVSLSGRIQAQ